MRERGDSEGIIIGGDMFVWFVYRYNMRDSHGEVSHAVEDHSRDAELGGGVTGPPKKAIGDQEVDGRKVFQGLLKLWLEFFDSLDEG